MAKFFIVEPEVAGGLGQHTVIDRSSGKMVVTDLHYEFEGWLGDHLLESTPCYIVTKELAQEIEIQKLSGVEFAFAKITLSDQFKELYPNKSVPDFIWLKVIGEPSKDDFGIASGLQLIVSEHALETLKRYGVSHAASIVPL
ncbi:hypothetical protein SBC1_41910 (plasmid) [Caballeronia sp. SBC1]|uniref:hypothetical protein n=1 Tax=unclassified Caballeronia TaxID=2646786 RepID=UPI0013E14D2A|nr:MULTISPECIES: hypothetical protein [unclassified Caballeronia]QIE26533.1 hypothetical protein SBC2_46030 [Caballeronia sp. SBC2]QIN64151.1 hypothetical protein SBC1_41910 [Caballeronia sp. SBC1]